MTILEFEQDQDQQVHDRTDASRWAGVEVRGYVEPDLEILSRAKGGDGRTIVGILVPYRVRQRIHEGLEEMFREGAAAHIVNRPKLVRFAHEHVKLGGKVIGRATELREDASGLLGHLRASRTDAGDEAVTLVEDGVIEELSIGFRAVRDQRHPDGLVERVRVDILEAALVLQGAYGQAARVTGLRAADAELEPDSDAEPEREAVTVAAAGGMSLEHARALAAIVAPHPATVADLRRLIR